MEKLLEILNELNTDIDFAHCDTLIDDGLHAVLNQPWMIRREMSVSALEISPDIGGF